MAALNYEKVNGLLYWASNIYYDLILLKKKKLYEMFSPDAALSIFGVLFIEAKLWGNI